MGDIPVVFIPGLLNDMRIFAPQMNALSRDRCVVVMPTIQQFGISEYVKRFMLDLPDRFALVGFDLGGMIAMEILRKMPERVDRIALIGSNALAETPQDAAAREAQIIDAKSGKFNDFIRRDYTKSVANISNRDGVIDALCAMALALGPEIYVDQIRAMQKRPDQQTPLRKCKVPAAVICGRDDPIIPLRRHEFLAQLIPYAKLHVIDFAGHFPTLENPVHTTNALKLWLSEPFVLRQLA